MKVFLHSIGCRLNQSEIETMARQLLMAGHEIVIDSTAADKVIINTCAVTAAATRDTRNFTRRVHRQNGAAEIILTGCHATIAPQEVGRLQGVGQVIANEDKQQLVQLAVDPLAQIPIFDQEPMTREYLAGTKGRTRAFVKVQDGCDNKCTFCITTIARGPGRSRPLGDVVAEIQALALAGYQEAVLTGVHLGGFGHDLGYRTSQNGLADLVTLILEQTEIPRLRLSSLEPWDIPTDFFRLWENRRLLPHLHMPLQSGSDNVLRRMARRTSRSSYRELVDEARARIPQLNLSTDIIVGFPGETEADFEQSMEFVRQIGFSRLHVFSYSKRPGTAAAKMLCHLPKEVKKERSRRMIELGNQLSLAFHRCFEGNTCDVLWENSVGADQNGLRWLGYTDNYIRVAANGPADLFNQVTPVRLRDARPDGISGRILPMSRS